MESVKLDTLKIFCDVVRWASFSRGAAENGISQSSASQAVRQLEKRLGVGLIDRSKRPLLPTPHGKIYYEGCKDLVGRYLELEERLKALGDDHKLAGTVRVAAIYSVGLHQLNRCVDRFHEVYPGASVHLQCLHPTRVVEAVCGQAAELGLMSFPPKGHDLTVIPWREEPMVVAVFPGHRFAGLEAIAVEQLDGEKLVHFDQDLAIRRAIDKFLRKHGVQVETTLEFDNIENIKRAVEDEAGVAILPEPTLEREVRSGSLVAVPFGDHHLVRPLAIIHRGSAALGITAARFLELLTGPHDTAGVA